MSASILTHADSGSGLAIKEADPNAASLLKPAGMKRQRAEFGDDCSALLADADTGSTMAVKEAGQNATPLLKSAGARRQLNRVGASTAALIVVADQDAADYKNGLTNNTDIDGASDSAVIGKQLGALKVEAGESAGNLVP